MTSISGLGSSAWSSMSSVAQRQPQKLSEKLTEKFDTDGSGALGTDELQSLMDDMSSRSGVTSTTSAKDLLAQSDANSDGSLDTSELEAAFASMQPPPSTMAFAQSRGDVPPDDLFSKVDADGSGGVNTQELQSLMSDMRGSSVSDEDAQAAFSALDSDGDGSLTQAEFDAARPQDAGGMPAPPPASSTSSSASAQGSEAAAGAGGAAPAGGASASASTTYDELDTNEDGVVSAAERLAGALKEASQQSVAATTATSADGSGSASARQDGRGETRNLLAQVASLAYQAASGMAQPATQTFSYVA